MSNKLTLRQYRALRLLATTGPASGWYGTTATVGNERIEYSTLGALVARDLVTRVDGLSLRGEWSIRDAGREYLATHDEPVRQSRVNYPLLFRDTKIARVLRYLCRQPTLRAPQADLTKMLEQRRYGRDGMLKAISWHEQPQSERYYWNEKTVGRRWLTCHEDASGRNWYQWRLTKSPEEYVAMMLPQHRHAAFSWVERRIHEGSEWEFWIQLLR